MSMRRQIREWANIIEEMAFPDNVADLTFRRISREDVPSIMDDIPSYLNNERYSRKRFEKYLSSKKSIDAKSRSDFFGLFDKSGRCLSMCYINYGIPVGFVLIAEIQSIVHGYGKPLLEKLFEMFDNIWLAADPAGGENLLKYYRQFGMDEVKLDYSKWVDGPETFFYVATGGEDEETILNYIKVSAAGH